MASKSKRANLNTQNNNTKIFMYWAVSVFIIKIAIIFRIEGINTGYGSGTYFVDGSWLGADGENYLTGYFALLKDGIFSADSILNYWPAGYPLLILFLSFFGKSWVLTTLSIFQSIVFSYAAYFFATELSKTRLRKFAHISLIIILLNPTLSLNSMAVGYESLTASGFLICLALIIKSFVVREEIKFVKYLIIYSFVFSFLAFVQPRLILSGLIIQIIWIIIWKGARASALLVALSIAITLFFPATLIYRNNKATGLTSISTNLGVTMNIGAGDKATGGYMVKDFGVPCDLSGSTVEQDNKRIRCVLEWYLANPNKAAKLFFNKSIYFWSPWYGPEANGTMARNPWLTISPLKSISTTPDGFNLIYGGFGKFISWLWLLGGLALLFYGYITLWVQNSLERVIGNISMIAISTNWLVTLISIGDHRFRIPIMGLSLFLQAIGLKTLLRGGKPAMVDGPTLR
jgi:hypothetical protein